MPAVPTGAGSGTGTGTPAGWTTIPSAVATSAAQGTAEGRLIRAPESPPKRARTAS